MAEEKITRELAEKEFLEWCEANEIDCDVSDMEDDMATAFASTKNDFVKAIKAGRLIFDGLDMEYTVSKFSPEGFAGEKIRVSRPSGNIWLAMDGKKIQTVCTKCRMQ